MLETSSYSRVSALMPAEAESSTPHSLFLSTLKRKDGSIDLSALQRIPGGGTHDIYKLPSDELPTFLLKVMQRSIGKNEADLQAELAKLTEQYSSLYQNFNPQRCLIEHRSIEEIAINGSSGTTPAIVSVVAFDPCFQSEKKFGFNVETIETDEVTINKNPDDFRKMNLALLGSESATEADLDKYLSLQQIPRDILQQLETDANLQQVMREFLTGYKQFYQQTGILMDLIGRDNVLFYKNSEGWQFKVGSVIKHDTKELVTQTLKEIAADPSLSTESFERTTATFYMPSCIRVLNALGLKLGMGKIVEDIRFTPEDSDALSKVYLHLKNSTRALTYAKHKSFAQALEFFDTHVAEEKEYESYLRDMLGTAYWQYLKDSGAEPAPAEMTKFLAMLTDSRNQFPPARQASVAEARDGLQAKFEVLNQPFKQLTQQPQN